MSLKPLLTSKVDELFARWVTEPETQLILKAGLQDIISQTKTENSSLLSATTSKNCDTLEAPSIGRSISPATPPYSPQASSSNRASRSPKPAHKSILISSRNSNELNEVNHINHPAGDTANRKLLKIPTFYFPLGQPMGRSKIASILNEVNKTSEQLVGAYFLRNDLWKVCQALGVSFYWRSLIFKKAGCIDRILASDLESLLHSMLHNYHDRASQFVYLASKMDSNVIEPDDLETLAQDVVDNHPGLSFLQEATQFHSRYITTVISRIFYTVNRSWSGKITVNEVRKSKLLETLDLLDTEDDINKITEFFSYEHFYVIYCKFWELDQDHDLLISKSDMQAYGDQAISLRVIDRIFSDAVIRKGHLQGGMMSYFDFVWFILSEEDKTSPTSIEYWFRCMDLDGDGFLTAFELEFFYEEQLARLESMNIETVPFEDCLCLMLDLVRPKLAGKITLSDLKNCHMTPYFFDTFFSLEKYLDHEQKDPFTNIKDPEEVELCPWDLFAGEQYRLLVAEEQAALDLGEEEEESGYRLDDIHL